MLERAIEGTATPIFYKGELVGERRRYDDRLAMFALRMRDPERFGSWREDRIPVQHPDAEAIRLRVALMRVNRVARAQEKGLRDPDPNPIAAPLLLTPEQKDAYTVLQAERAEAAAEEARRRRWLKEDEIEIPGLDAELDAKGGT